MGLGAAKKRWGAGEWGHVFLLCTSGVSLKGRNALELLLAQARLLQWSHEPIPPTRAAPSASDQQGRRTHRQAPSGLRTLLSLGTDPPGPGATVHTLHHRGRQARRAAPIKVSLSLPSAHRKHKKGGRGQEVLPHPGLMQQCWVELSLLHRSTISPVPQPHVLQ